MANSLYGKIINLDTWDPAVDLGTQFPNQMYVHSIEWVGSTAAEQACQILVGGASGPKIVDWLTTASGARFIKYVEDWIPPLYVAVSGVDAGTVIVHIK